jgi:hypothetical protein
VPAGAIFHDVGPVDDVTGPWIKLRIVTLAAARIKGNEKCKVVSAAIPDTDPSGWGNIQIGPVITKVSPIDGRLLEIESWGEGPSPPPKLAP